MPRESKDSKSTAPMKTWSIGNWTRASDPAKETENNQLNNLLETKLNEITPLSGPQLLMPVREAPLQKDHQKVQSMQVQTTSSQPVLMIQTRQKIHDSPREVLLR